MEKNENKMEFIWSEKIYKSRRYGKYVKERLHSDTVMVGSMNEFDFMVMDMRTMTGDNKYKIIVTEKITHNIEVDIKDDMCGCIYEAIKGINNIKLKQ